MLKIIEKTKVWFAISLIIISVGLIALAVRGLNVGIDFAGGTVLTIQVGKEFNVEDVRKIAAKYDSQAQVQAVQGNEVTIRGKDINDTQAKQLFNDVKAKYNLKDDALRSTDRIGATVGKEITKNSILAMLVASVLMLVYITFRFEFKSGVAAIVALVHDILVTLAVYTVLHITVNSSFIAAMLTILGYSINDTIVVFDRIRENRKLGKFKDYTTLANASITQTMARSINTVLTTLITITAVYILGVPSIKEFALPLIVGIVSGCYSSIFIASPIWVMWKKKEKYA